MVLENCEVKLLSEVKFLLFSFPSAASFLLSVECGLGSLETLSATSCIPGIHLETCEVKLLSKKPGSFFALFWFGLTVSFAFIMECGLEWLGPPTVRTVLPVIVLETCEFKLLSEELGDVLLIRLLPLSYFFSFVNENWIGVAKSTNYYTEYSGNGFGNL